MHKPKYRVRRDHSDNSPFVNSPIFIICEASYEEDGSLRWLDEDIPGISAGSREELKVMLQQMLAACSMPCYDYIYRDKGFPDLIEENPEMEAQND